MKFEFDKLRKDVKLGDIVISDDVYLIIKTIEHRYTVVNMSKFYVSNTTYKTVEGLMEDYFSGEKDLRIIPGENIVVSTI
ncbi:MAG: hypothetical protein ACRDD7_02425 [Peptostreptococcaceae bacterium]